jgi:hypothetical protein
MTWLYDRDTELVFHEQFLGRLVRGQFSNRTVCKQRMRPSVRPDDVSCVFKDWTCDHPMYQVFPGPYTVTKKWARRPRALRIGKGVLRSPTHNQSSKVIAGEIPGCSFQSWRSCRRGLQMPGSSEGTDMLAGPSAELMVEEIETAQFAIRMSCGK